MMSQFTRDVSGLIEKDSKTVLLLSGIRQFSFREVMGKYPKRAFDIGIMEDGAVSVAAGLSASGLIPFLHTWAPFLVERTYEQLKLDFGAQGLQGNFISAGASYDLADFGESHYCPADVPILKQIRNMEIIVPGTAGEFSRLLAECYNDGKPTYYRLSERVNERSYEVSFGKAVVIQKGNRGTIIAVGPMLDRILNVAESMDVTILYYTTVEPFDTETLQQNLSGDKIMICEPYNSGAVLPDIIHALSGEKIKTQCMGFDKAMGCRLGTYDENLTGWELDRQSIEKRLQRFLEE